MPNLLGYGVFQQLRERGGQERGGERQAETEEVHLQKYLDSELETVACLMYRETQENEFGSNPMRAALCRLARYSLYFIVYILMKIIINRKFLTPPPTSTDVERLFSTAGLLADDKRAKLLPENLERLLFLRENILLLNFEINWD